MPCTKRSYVSERTARLATQRVGWRIKTYYCDECRAYHVANAEKREETKFREDVKGETRWQTPKKTRDPYRRR